MRLGVDTGGTFTDFVLLDQGRLRVLKRFSTLDDPARSFLAGVRELVQDRPVEIVHGTTVATNALLERRGARTALITTAGFGDVLEIGRQNRPHLYQLHPQRPPPLVPASLRYEVQERVGTGGEVLVPLDRAEVERLVAQVRQAGASSVAVCLLFSFFRPEHEQLLGRALRDAGIVPSLSSDVIPEFREYERTATTVANAYVAPVMSAYLRRVSEAGAALGQELHVMQSNGGRCSARFAAAQPVRTILSGPAAGVIGALWVAREAGYTRVMTFDMGGTSTDVSLSTGQAEVSSERTVAGLPIRIPALAIHTVGAGGGSIAARDAAGALAVGPRSAGADPGPAAYGRGGHEPTVTDANVALGRLAPERFLGGQVRLDADAARRALARLGSRPETVAAAILAIANASMERALRVISVERGHDPREFTLVAFGGAGPMHACELAAALRIPRVLVPPHPGLLCALGALVADAVLEASQTVMWSIPPSGPPAHLAAALRQTLRALRHRLVADARGDPAFTAPAFQAEADVRYAGQSYELRVPLVSLGSAVAAFEAAHEQRYGRRFSGRAFEIVNVRLRCIGQTERPRLERQPEGDADAGGALVGETPLALTHPQRPDVVRWTRAALYDRARLRPGHRFRGPALVTQLDSTTYVPSDWQARVDPFGNLILER